MKPIPRAHCFFIGVFVSLSCAKHANKDNPGHIGMSDTAPYSSARLDYPPGFRARRGLNWGFVGLLYTSFYMCRYNLSIANSSISKEFGFTRADMGVIITTSLLAYAFGQIINGLICDKIGGKRSMLIGAAGTILMNILFGAASFCGVLGP